jgi:Ca-activated chloride channel homolog
VIGPSLALAAPWVIVLALGVALLVFVRRRRRVARALGDPDLIVRLMGTDLRRPPLATIAAVLVAGLALGGAISLATRQTEAAPAPGSGGALVLVLDASNSMLAADVEPDRMELQREAARRIARAVPQARIGIVVFAGRAYTLAPPTHDHNAVGVFLDVIDPAMVTQEGSSVLAAVRQGVGLLVAGEENATGGTLVLITDGDEPYEPAAFEPTLQLASRAGVVIHTLGAGTREGAAVPLPDSQPDGAARFMTDREGTPIITRLQDRALRDIAASTGGTYVHLDRLERVEEIVRRLPVSTIASGQEERRFEPHALLAATALLLLALQVGFASIRRGEG